MTFVRCYEDMNNESDKIWKHHWRYIIKGRDFHKLQRPFDIRRVQRSQRNYGHGAINFVYIDDLDALAIRSGGHLEPLA